MDWLGYIRTLADAMGLRDWTFRIDDVLADEGYDAGIRCIYGQRHAVIRLSADLQGYDPEKQRYVLVHELVHPHLDPIDTVKCRVEGSLGSIAWPLFDLAMGTAIEDATDAIARILAPFLPLPLDVPVVSREPG